MDLEKQIAAKSQEIATDAYTMSIGELIGLYQNNELDIHPEFQRFFRWTPSQKSSFIESLLLGIPIPSIFVSQRRDGVWELVDGLQRVSTILEFTGDLKRKSGETVEPLELLETTYLPALKGLTWDGTPNTRALPPSAKLKIKRSRLDVKIVLNTSDPRAKYELFRRLNTGGAFATDQEVRNCLLLMSNARFFDWFFGLGGNADYKTCIPLSERLEKEAYDYELLSRFIVLRRADIGTLKSVADLGTYLTDMLIAMSEDPLFDYAREEMAFRKAFAILNDALGEDAFRRYDSERERAMGPFLVSMFEVLGIGMGFHADRDSFSPSAVEVRAMHHRIWNQMSLDGISGSGIAAATRLPKTLKLGRELFDHAA